MEEIFFIKFELDVFFLFEFLLEGVFKVIVREVSRKYFIKFEDIKIFFFKVYFLMVYIIFWLVREGESEEKGKVLVFLEEKIVF